MAVQNPDKCSGLVTKLIKSQSSHITTLRNNDLDRLLRDFECHWQLAYQFTLRIAYERKDR